MERTRQEGIGDLVKRIADDIKVIARDEVALARTEIASSARGAATDAAAIMLGGVVALIGLGILCTAAVIALDAWIASLALRMVLMAVVYLALGGALATLFGRKLGRDIKPDLSRPQLEARRTFKAVKEQVHHA